MAISTTCPGCKALFELPDDLAGESVRCEKCGEIFEVPALEALDVPEEAELVSDAAEPEVADAVPEPAPVSEKTPSPSPAPPPERQASVVGTLLLLLLFIASVLGVGGAAAIWIATHLGPSLPPYVPPKPFVNVNVGNDVIIDPRPDNPRIGHWMVPDPLAFLPDGRIAVNGQTNLLGGMDHGKWSQTGPYQLCRVSLKAGTTYNFHVSGFGFAPRLRIVDGEMVLADREGQAPFNRVMVSLRPNRTGDFVVWVTTQQRVVAGYALNIAPENPGVPLQVDLTAQASFTDNRWLLIFDPLDPAQFQFGPYREYEVKLKPNQDYVISHSMADPVLMVNDQAVGVIHPVRDKGVAELTIRTRNDDKVRIRVTSNQYLLGNYTLRITPNRPAVHTILALLDDRDYTDMKAFAASDPPYANQGVHKVYLFTLDEGKKYRFDFLLGAPRASLTLFDPDNRQVEESVNQRNPTIAHRANQTGTYQLIVAAPLTNQRVDYTLRITADLPPR